MGANEKASAAFHGSTPEDAARRSVSETDGRMPTSCVRCGATEVLTTAEALDFARQHGPGKCQSTKKGA